MARITVEDCLQKVNNRFALIHMAAKRVRQLRKGAEPTIVSKNRDVVIALREIAAGNVVILPEGQRALGEPAAEEALPEPAQEEILIGTDELDTAGMSVREEQGSEAEEETEEDRSLE